MSSKLQRRSSELAEAVPQVIAHRMMMMQPGFQSATTQWREANRMWSEKASAFGLSWLAMTQESARFQCHLASRLSACAMTPWQWPMETARVLASDTPVAMERIANAGLKPLHRRATANARRLSGQATD